MNQRRFFIELAVVSLVAILIVIGLQQLAFLKPYGLLAWLSLAFFMLVSLLMYYSGYRAAHSDNKNTFTNVVIGYTTAKMFLSVIIVLIYGKLAAPPDKFYILPFFAIYLIYTIFETRFMMKLGKMNT